MNKNLVEQISKVSKVEKWPYPKTFKSLKDAGVLSYQVDTSTYLTIFYGKNELFEICAPQDFKCLNIAKDYNIVLIKSAIQNSQKGLIDYPQFLKEIAQAGVSHYLVEMPLNKITYFGARPGEEYIESIPDFDRVS